MALPTLRLRIIVRLVMWVLLVLLLVAPSGDVGASVSPAGQIPPSQIPSILLTDPVPDPRQRDVQYFSTTSHTLRGSFLFFWRRHGGLAQFGYPLTEVFIDATTPANQLMQVQYFERARLEYHPEKKGTGAEVTMGTLSRELRVPEARANPTPGVLYFTQTGHNLSGAFEKYWNAHGGASMQGYPLTEEFSEINPLEGGKPEIVQYFERVRMERHPEYQGTAYEVLLGALGTQLALQRGYFAGKYPLYGYAFDYSWVAGQLRVDPRTCPGCGCSTVLYTQDVGDKSRSVQLPEAEIKVPNDTSHTIRSFSNVVIFGYPLETPS